MSLNIPERDEMERQSPFTISPSVRVYMSASLYGYRFSRLKEFRIQYISSIVECQRGNKTLPVSQPNVSEPVPGRESKRTVLSNSHSSDSYGMENPDSLVPPLRVRSRKTRRNEVGLALASCHVMMRTNGLHPDNVLGWSVLWRRPCRLLKEADRRCPSSSLTTSSPSSRFPYEPT